MSIFDRLKNDSEERQDRFETFRRESAGSNSASDREAPPLKAPGGVAVYKPKSYAEVVEIIEHLRKSAPAIVYLDMIKESTAQRVSDILSGAIIALVGSMYEIQPKIFIYTPSGVDVKLD